MEGCAFTIHFAKQKLTIENLRFSSEWSVCLLIFYMVEINFNAEFLNIFPNIYIFYLFTIAFYSTMYKPVFLLNEKYLLTKYALFIIILYFLCDRFI